MPPTTLLPDSQWQTTGFRSLVWVSRPWGSRPWIHVSIGQWVRHHVHIEAAATACKRPPPKRRWPTFSEERWEPPCRPRNPSRPECRPDRTGVPRSVRAQKTRKQRLKTRNPGKRPGICLTQAWKALHFRGFRLILSSRTPGSGTIRLTPSQGLAPCSYCREKKTRASSSTTTSRSLWSRFVATKCDSALRHRRRFLCIAARFSMRSCGENRLISRLFLLQRMLLRRRPSIPSRPTSRSSSRHRVTWRKSAKRGYA